MLFWIILSILWLPVRLLLPTKLIGKENLIKGKSIYACNHQSNFDIVVLAVRLYTKIYALGKAELNKNKFIAWFLRNINMISVNRGQADIKAVKSCLRVLKEENKPLVIFPTGTRTSNAEEVENLKNGVAMFSIKAQAPIVPMVFVRKNKLFRRNRFVIGKPLDLSKYEGRKPDKELFKEISDDLSQAMQKLLDENKFKQKVKKTKKVEVK